MEKNKILVNKKDFEPRHIFECGQVFRFKEEGGAYEIISDDKRAAVAPGGDGYVITTDEPEYFKKYFDLSEDYGAVKEKILKDHGTPFMREAVAFGSGIRILKQNLHETVFSFIVSANNNINRIRAIIERIAERAGQERGGYYAFPSASALAAKSETFYKEAGLGYRAEYFPDAARVLDGGFDFARIDGMDSDEANKYLCRIPGVGAKVADCILLFALARHDVFPVDTWMEKVYLEYFNDGGYAPTRAEIARRAKAKFGALAGFVQQYLFYYKRTGAAGDLL